MTVDLKKETPSLAHLKKPTGRDYLLFYGVGIAGALVLGALALALDWSKLAFLVAALALEAAYVPIAVTVLHTRRERLEPAQS